jgi:hypothetical protein
MINCFHHSIWSRSRSCGELATRGIGDTSQVGYRLTTMLPGIRAARNCADHPDRSLQQCGFRFVSRFGYRTSCQLTVTDEKTHWDLAAFRPPGHSILLLEHIYSHSV